MLYTPDKPVWHTDTKGAKDVRLLLQDDRNLVLYGFDGPAWASNTQTDEAPPPPPAAEAPTPEVVPPPQEPQAAAAGRRARRRAAAAAAATTSAARSADVHGGLRRHPVGHLGALLRRRQQVPADRRRQRHLQPRPDPSRPGADHPVTERRSSLGPNVIGSPAVRQTFEFRRAEQYTGALLVSRVNDMADTISEGQKLEKGGSLTSRNGAYTLTLQDDGNLVLAARGQAVWATGTNGQNAERA